VHAGPVVPKQRLGHEGDRLPIPPGHVLDDVLVPLEPVGHLDQGRRLHVDFRLPGGGHFVVLAFHGNPHLLHDQDHLGAQVLLGIHGGHGEIPLFVAGLVTQVRVLHSPAVPDSFGGIDEVIAELGGVVEADVVEDEKLRLGADKGRIPDARELQVGFGLLGDVAGISRVFFLGHGIHHVADHGEGGNRHEGVQGRRGRIGEDQHVTGMNGLPASNARPVEPVPVLEVRFAQLRDGIAEMLPCADKVHEFEIHHLGAVLLGKGQDFFGCHAPSS